MVWNENAIRANFIIHSTQVSLTHAENGVKITRSSEAIRNRKELEMTLGFLKPANRRFIAGALSVLLVLAFLFSALPQAAFASSLAEENACSKNHTVAAGDTLSSISVKYDVSIQEIASANNLTQPYTLQVGQSLCIPSAAAASTTATPSATDTASTSSSGSSSSSTSSSKDPALTLSVDKSMLTVKGTNFPTKSSFYVKISPSSYRNLHWSKIGMMKTGKESGVTATYKLPKGFTVLPTILVCVKNATTDDTLCKRVATGVSDKSKK
jgi:LysM repeat protein